MWGRDLRTKGPVLSLTVQDTETQMHMAFAGITQLDSGRHAS